MSSIWPRPSFSSQQDAHRGDDVLLAQHADGIRHFLGEKPRRMFIFTRPTADRS